MSACIADHAERTEAETGQLCRRHRRQLDDLTSEIGLLIVDTCRIRDGGAPQEHTEKTRWVKSPEAPAPGNLTLIAMFDPRTAATRLPGTTDNPAGDQSEPVGNVLHTVSSWLLLVAEERPLTAALPRSVLVQLDLLKRHHDWIAAQDWVDDYAAELGEVRKALRVAVREGGERAVGRCPSQDDNGAVCNGPLFPVEGEMAVDCRRCRRHYGEEYLRHLGGMIAG